MYHRSIYLLFLVLNLSVFGATSRAQSNEPLPPSTEKTSVESPPAQPSNETANVPAVPLPKEFGSDSFAKGIQQLQTKDASGALTSFREALLQHPDDTAILTNLGIAAQEAGLKGWAIAYLREALTLGSRLRETRQALEYSLSQLQVKELPHEIEPWEKLRENVLVGISLPWLLFFNGGALLLFGIVWIRFLKERKLAFENESLLPTLRPMHWAASFVFLISLSLVACKILDLSEVRATIVAEKVSAYSAPSSEAPTLFEITEGLEVLVQREEGKWLQIRYPGGPTGWVNLDQVHITQSQNLLKGGI